MQMNVRNEMEALIRIDYHDRLIISCNLLAPLQRHVYLPALINTTVMKVIDWNVTHPA